MKSCSLTIVCVIFLVVILFMMFSGSNNNMYRLIEGMEPKKEGNVFTDAMSSTLSASKMLLPGGPLLAGPSGNDDEKDKKDKEDDDTTESFQVRPPHSFSDIVETKDDSWNLTTWVKNAQRYSKGMGNENKIDSYKYNAGPTIPLPEGQLFFFNNTKFDSECCPATYSSSRGCACLSQPQYNHLMMRGGNNTPPKNTNTSYFNEF